MTRHLAMGIWTKMESETGERAITNTSNLSQQLSNVAFENNEEFGRILNEFGSVHSQVWCIANLYHIRPLMK